MKHCGNQYTFASVHLFTAAILAATLVFAPCVVFAADKVAHEDRAELRIKDMRTKFKITAAQEEQWSKVAAVMLDNGKTMDTLTQARVDHAKDLSAVDDLKSYGEIADAHAAGIKKLIPIFADLYATMSDAQKKEADTFFRNGYHQGKQKKSSAK